LADCKFTNDQNNHSDWVSTVRYSPVNKNPYFATAGWDGKLKIWNQNFSIKYTFKAHQDNINSMAIAPLGTYIATGGKENVLKVWDLSDLSEEFRELKAGSSINKVAFNPKMQWIAAATDNGVKIFNLNSEKDQPFSEITVPRPKKEGKLKGASDKFACTAIAWNSTGTKLFAAFTDNVIRVYHFTSGSA
jgi:guanine nucleotide-binding protein subunit beta-2-like 1 protein